VTLIKLRPPLTEREVAKLKAGDLVSISGIIVTARDKSYARVLDLLRSHKRLPVEMRGGVIYHCGPLVKKTPRGRKIISAGPTTSARLDRMQTEFVRRTGVKALVGKGASVKRLL